MSPLFYPQPKLPFLFKSANKNGGAPLKLSFLEKFFEMRGNLLFDRHKTFCAVLVVFVRIIQVLRLRSIDNEDGKGRDKSA